MKLLDYIRGLRQGKEAHQLEKESMKDPFLADAMDGYNQIEGNHEKQIEILHRKISVQSIRKRNHTLIWSVAASLLIGICISSYFLSQVPPLMNTPVVSPENKQQELAKVTLRDSIEKDITAKAKVAPSISIRTDEPDAETVNPENETLKDSDWIREQIMEIASNANIVRGKVTDESGNPIAGASIELKGTSLWTVSDIHGNFTLQTEDYKDLIINSIGYKPASISADTCKNLLIAMNKDDQSLNEVIVVGFGKQKKNSLVGSISTANISNLSAEPVIGEQEYKKYLEEKLIRPTDKCAEVEGEVIVMFYVDEKGRPEKVQIKKSLCDSADKEAMRLVIEGADWTQSNHPVEVSVIF